MEIINDKNINVALIGVKKTPESIAGKSGVMKIEKTGEKDIFKIDSFSINKCPDK